MQFVVFQNFNLIDDASKQPFYIGNANQQNILNYAAKFQKPAFNDGNIFTLKNDLLLLCGISKTFLYFDLRKDLIKKTNKVTF